MTTLLLSESSCESYVIALAAVALPFLDQLVVLLAVCLLLTYLCHRVGMLPIVGFLLAGILLGPDVLALIDDEELINQLAEIGVILLLFTIGIEFSLDKLSRIARFVFLGGGLQVGITIGVTLAILVLSGIDWRSGLFTGCLVALSSTAIVLTILADKKTIGTPAGQQMLGVLIFQDLAIIAMALLVPLLSGSETSVRALFFSLFEAIVLIGVVLLLARKIIPWLFERIADVGRPELFILSVAFVCLGTAWAMSLAGVSLALGAFLAGLVVSESHYSSYALSEILPFRTLFNAIFFVSIGMLLDIDFVWANLGVIVLVAAGVVLIKWLITGGVIMSIGYPLRIAAPVGLSLAQIGEFSFVLERAGKAAGVTPLGMGTTGGQIFIAATVLLMLATPLLMGSASRLGGWLSRKLGTAEVENDAIDDEQDGHAIEDHAIVVGYGPGGRRLVHVMKETQIPLVVVEINPDAVRQAEKDGVRVVRGDALRPHILEAASLASAKLIVLLIDDASTSRRVVDLVHFMNPTLQIVVRTRYLSEVDPLHAAGADFVVPEELETAIRMFAHVMGAYMVPSEEVVKQVNAMRSDDYRLFRGSMHEAHLMVLQGLDDEGLHTRAVAAREGSHVVGRTLNELALRNEYGITVLAIRRDGRTMGNPAGDYCIQAGDRLVLIGSAHQFAACAHLFRDSVVGPGGVTPARTG